MGDVYIARRGGGSRAVEYARINIEYPRGSACTVERLSAGGVIIETLAQPDVSGHWYCAVPVGTYVVRCWDGAYSATSGALSIAANTSVDVALDYYLRILSKGKLMDGYTFTKSSGAIVFPDAEGRLYQNNTDTTGGYWCLTPAVDVTNYENIFIRIKGVVRSDKYPVKFGIRKTELKTAVYANRGFVEENGYLVEDWNKTLVDCADYSGKYFLGGSGVGEYYVSSIILLPGRS